MDRDGTRQLLPSDRVGRDEALFYVALAGELVAEVVGINPEYWASLLREVREFEAAQGLDAA